MPEVLYTKDGYPYYQNDSVDGNPLYSPAQPESVGNNPALPVEYDPTQYQGLQPNQSTGVKAIDKLLGTGGQERYQLWPEKIVREAIEGTHNVATGQYDLQPGMVSDEDISKSQEGMSNTASAMSNLAGVSGPAAMVKGAGMMGGKLVQPKFNAEFIKKGTNSQVSKDTEVLINPPENEAKKYIHEIKNARTMTDKDGNLYLWNADAATHEGVANSLKLNVDNWGNELFTHNGKIYPKGDLKEGYPKWLSTLFSDNQAPALLNYDLKQVPTFYSAVENAVSNIKQAKMSGEQWLGTIANSKGVKPEELEWTGLGEFLNGKKDVTKADIEKHLENNKVELKEVGKGGENNIDDEGVLNLGDTTKYHSYQLPGGENYRETLLTLPYRQSTNKWTTKQYKEDGWTVFDEKGREVGNFPADNSNQAIEYAANVRGKAAEHRNIRGEYQSSHWDEPNVLAHIRMNDRFMPDTNGPSQKFGIKNEKPVENGFKSLHLEEIQSDWHQQGRDRGYKITDAQKVELEKIDDKLTSKLSEKDIGNPDIHEVLKTAVDQKIINEKEAQNYKDWSKGENSNIPDAPFKKTWLDLSLKRMLREAAEKGYDRLSWTPGEAQAARYDLSKQIDRIRYYGDKRLVALDKNGAKILDKEVKPSELADHIGKEPAEKLIKAERQKVSDAYSATMNLRDMQELKNADLKIGGEGMHEFYDKMLPKVLERLGKEHGVKVKDYAEKAKVTDFADEKGIYWVGIRNNERFKDGSNFLTPRFKTKAEAEKYVNDYNVTTNKYKYIDIPQSLKDQALHKGFPLFSSGMMLSPIDNNPFTDNKYKLVPVEKPEFE